MTVRPSHNFIIDTLGFHKILDNQDHVYERATAPFRKEQFDAAPKVGDQSLTGWWTRGQLSFHQGAGIKYYEVLDGEEVFNRFTTSENVDVTTPGRVSLTRTAMVGPVTTVGVYDLVATPNDLNYAWVASDGKVYRTDASGAATLISATPNSSGNGRAVTADNTYFYLPVDGSLLARFQAVSGTPTTSTNLYSSSTEFVNVWHAKGRLWAVTANNDVYTLAKNPTGTLPVAVASSDLLFSVPDANSGMWRLAATPSTVYLSNMNTIYRVDMNTDGSVPTLTGGIVAAELAQDEPVQAMCYHLGFLILSTEKGIRVAATNADGSLTLGPLIVQGSGSVGSRLAALGSSVYALVQDPLNEPTGTRLVRVNLDQSISELVFAYSSTQVAAGFITGGVTAENSRVMVWSRNTLAASGKYMEEWEGDNTGIAYSSTGSVTTGFHRFGTLEGKHFAGVKVRAAGTGGTITVYLLQQDGTQTQLMTIDLATETAGEVSLVNTPPLEAAALKFVLSRDPLDSKNGPELLGYQVKALPAPVRQRLIRVPLMMFDTERGPTGRSVGAEESAWTRLQELEALELSDSLVSFEDKDTGESGMVFIESVEMVQKNGSQGRSRSNGFGGVVTLTLRKV